LDPGETKEKAAIREIKEELCYGVKNLQYLGSLTKVIERYEDPNDKRKITLEIFVSKINEDPSLFQVKEGGGLGFFTLKEARKLVMVPKLDEEALTIMEKFMDNL
jgi:8-oxo-dGTP pyrophosphatase MutT (NUDIX family)